MAEYAVRLHVPDLGGNCREYARLALDGGSELGHGHFVDRLEDLTASLLGRRFAVGVSSGTAALHLAFRCLGIGEGDDVAMPALTFLAPAHPPRYPPAPRPSCWS